MIKNFEAKAYAKINLCLDIIGKRDDGYHLLNGVMQSVSLHDTLSFKLNKTGRISLNIESEMPESRNLLDNKDNLVIRAVNIMFDKFNIKDGIEINLKKKIPLQAGMGGGSSDCAAALIAVNEMFDLSLSKEKLCDMGVKLGADVPFCIYNGTMRAEGIGEILSPLPSIPDCFILIAKPIKGLSTAEIFADLDSSGSITKRPDVDSFVSALNNRNLKVMCENMINVMEEASMRKIPQIGTLKALMLENNALCSIQTGSGPTVFGIYEDIESAEKAYSLIEKSCCKDVHILSPVNKGSYSIGG